MLIIPNTIDRHTFNGLFQDNLGKPAPERFNHSGF